MTWLMSVQVWRDCSGAVPGDPVKLVTLEPPLKKSWNATAMPAMAMNVARRQVLMGSDVGRRMIISRVAVRVRFYRTSRHILQVLINKGLRFRARRLWSED